MTEKWNTICARPLAILEMQSITSVKSNINRQGDLCVKHEMQLRERMKTNAKQTMPSQMPCHTCDELKMHYKM